MGSSNPEKIYIRDDKHDKETRGVSYIIPFISYGGMGDDG